MGDLNFAFWRVLVPLLNWSSAASSSTFGLATCGANKFRGSVSCRSIPCILRAFNFRLSYTGRGSVWLRVILVPRWVSLNWLLQDTLWAHVNYLIRRKKRISKNKISFQCLKRQTEDMIAFLGIHKIPLSLNASGQSFNRKRDELWRIWYNVQERLQQWEWIVPN